MRVSGWACRTVLLSLLMALVSVAVQAQSLKQDLLFKKLQAAIAQEDRDLEGVLGVAIVDLASGQSLLHNADEVFPVASSIKLAVLAELYHQAGQAAGGAAGKARLTDLYTMDAADLVEESPVMAALTPGISRVTYRDLASFMVTTSDNAATNVLIGRLGIENVNALLVAQGLKETRLRRRMLDLAAAREGRENTSTPLEMAALLEALYRGKVLDKASTDDVFKLLSVPKDKYIPRGLPADVVVANKPGWLDGVRTDSGIVFAKDRPFVVSVMTTFDADEAAAERTIGRIAAAAYRHFDRLGRASPYGRLLGAR
jgi:beta-lactamase class A